MALKKVKSLVLAFVVLFQTIPVMASVEPEEIEPDQTIVERQISGSSVNADEPAEEESAVNEEIDTIEEGAPDIDDDVAALTMESILKTNLSADEVVAALNLPRRGELADSTIIWSADITENLPVDLSTGAVTRPEYGDNVDVTLTALLQSGTEKREKEFQLTVRAKNYGANLARGKTAVASSVYSATYNEAKMLDGDRTGTRWGSKSGVANCDFVVDLKAKQTLSEIQIYEYGNRVVNFEILVSDDNINFTRAKKVENMPVSGTISQHRNFAICFPPVSGRYVKFDMTDCLNPPTFFEFEVYDTSKRYFPLKAVPNDDRLGTVITPAGERGREGDEISLTAEETDMGAFEQWIIPEGIELTGGSAQEREISLIMPAEPLELTAIFNRKKDAKLSDGIAVYDLYEKSPDHKAVTVTLAQNDFQLQEISNGINVLQDGVEYTVDGNAYTFKQEYLQTFTETQNIYFKMNGGEMPVLSIKYTNSEPEHLIELDFAELVLPPYNLVDGTSLDAVGKNGCDITITSSRTDVVSITQEERDGKRMNVLHVNTPAKTQTVYLTFTVSKETAAKSEIYTYSVKGSNTGNSGGSSGSSGGGGGRGGSFTGILPVGSPVPTASPKPEPKPEPEPSFNDLEQAEWAAEDIRLLAEKKIVASGADVSFHPNAKITREEFVKMLVLAVGLEPASGNSMPFEDIETGHWSYPFVSAAYEKNIVGGVSDTAFGIGAQITRQDIAVLTDRALTYLNIDSVGGTDTDRSFTDVAQIADYASGSVLAMTQLGLLSGYPDGDYRPLDSVTRAESAKIIAGLLRLKEE